MPLQAPATLPSRRRTLTGLLATAGTVLAGCSGNSSLLNSLPTLSSGPATPSVPESTLGTGQVKVGLILPLSSGGNAGLAGQSMRNAAELALAEFSSPNIQLLVKDDAGSADAARTQAQQALDEGAEIILGPLFAQSVSAVAQVARLRNVPVIAFSTDANVAASGVYLLSFLPESDVNRIVDYAYSTGKRSYAALIPDNPYGTVVDAAFRQVVTRRGARIVGLEHYPHDPAAQADAIKNVAQASSHVDALLLPDGGDALPSVLQRLSASGLDKKTQLLGTGLWDDPRITANAAFAGGWYAAPDANGYRGFSERYRARFKQEPVRTATLAYDAVALVAALANKMQGPQRFSQSVLTNSSGFTGIDGLFRFLPDGTNQRGLAVIRITTTGTQTISPAPRSFSGSGI
jgi:ABC-type branched-subunit amino acid transport system substrate-binding protein